MSNWLRFTTLAGLAGFAAGCSTPAPPEKYPSVETWADGMATAECDSIAGKCGIVPMKCVSTRKTFWTGVAGAIGARKYSSALAEACVAAWRAANADGVLKPNELDDSPSSPTAVCNRVFVGTVKTEGVCKDAFECLNASEICDEVGMTKAGSTSLCAVKKEVAAGGNCANPGEVCAKGSFCGDMNGVAKCVARKAKGDACDDKAPCGEDLFCDAMKCTERFVAGTKCASGEQCAPAAPLCIQGAMDQKCVDQITFALDAPVCKPYGGA